MLKLRTLIIGLFAIAGATVSVWVVPTILDLIFDSVKASNTEAQVDVQVKKHVFRKIVFRGQNAETDAASAYSKAKSGAVPFEEQCKKAGARCEEIQYLDMAMDRADRKPLTLLTKPGQLAIVQDDPVKQSVSLYELKSLEKSTPPGPFDETQKGKVTHDISILIALALLGAILGGGFGNVALKVGESGARAWSGMETGDRVNLFLGIVVGIIGSLPFLIALGNLGPVVASLLTLGLTLGFSSLSVYALNSMQEVLPWKKGEVRGRKSGIKILDTNVLIDGRIYDLARTGFLEGELYVPKFVLKELQHIADSPDSLRRQRGRRGLDVLRHIQADHVVEIGIHDRFAPDELEEVDSRLVKLAKALGADLISNDYNLNRVASIQEVRVLNINDLALSLRPNVLPGETLELSIIREGSQPGQGVGYLDDGTMVVVENARVAIGELVEVTVTQVIQTERGKMIFGSFGEGEEWRQNGNRR